MATTVYEREIGVDDGDNVICIGNRMGASEIQDLYDACFQKLLNFQQVSFIRPLFENVLSPLRAVLRVFIFALVL